MFAKMAMMHPEEIGFLDSTRFYWETETFWDLTLYISLPVFYLAYFLFQFFFFVLCGTQITSSRLKTKQALNMREFL